MKINKKIILTLSLLLVFGVLSVYLYLKVIFSPDRLIRAFENAAAETVGGKIEIANAYIRPGSIVLSDVSADLPAGDGMSASVRVHRIFMRYRTFPALKGEFLINSLHFDKPSAEIVRNGDFEGVDTSKIYSSIEGYDFEIKSLRLSNGAISYSNNDSDLFSLEDVFFVFERAESTNIAEYSGGGQISGESDSLLRFSGNIDFIRDRISLGELELRAYGGQLTLTGRLNNFSDAPSLEGRYSITSLPTELFPEEIHLKGEMELRGRIQKNAEGTSLDYTLDMTKSRVECFEIFKKPTRSKMLLRGGILRRGGGISLDWYVLELGASAFSGTGYIGDDKKSKLNLIANEIDFANLSSFFPPWRKYMVSGKGDFRAELSGNIFDPTVEIDIEASEVSLKNFTALENFIKRTTGERLSLIELGDLKASVLLNKDKLHLKRVTAKDGFLEGNINGEYCFDGNFDFNLVPKLYGNSYRLQINGKPEGVSVYLK